MDRPVRADQQHGLLNIADSQNIVQASLLFDVTQCICSLISNSAAVSVPRLVYTCQAVAIMTGRWQAASMMSTVHTTVLKRSHVRRGIGLMSVKTPKYSAI